MKDPDFKRKNDRRYELIVKEVDGDITPQEAQELKELQQWMEDYLEENHPLPELPPGYAGDWDSNPSTQIFAKGFACRKCPMVTELNYPVTDEDLELEDYDIIAEDHTGVMLSGLCPQCKKGDYFG